MVVPPISTPKWSFLVGKPMVVGYHRFRKPPNVGWKWFESLTGRTSDERTVDSSGPTFVRIHACHRPVELHFHVHATWKFQLDRGGSWDESYWCQGWHGWTKVDPKWQENEEYYEDLQGLLDRSGSLVFPWVLLKSRFHLRVCWI